MPDQTLIAYPVDLIERVVGYLDGCPHRDVRPIMDGLRTQGRNVRAPEPAPASEASPQASES